jgi:hypothetical protein
LNSNELKIQYSLNSESYPTIIQKNSEKIYELSKNSTDDLNQNNMR